MAQKNRYHGPASATRSIDPIPNLRIEEGHPIPRIMMSEKAWKVISEVVSGNPRKECGALLIGNILRDRVTGATLAMVDDAYTDGDYGGMSEYKFSAATQAHCVNYVFRSYGDTKHVIGTVHSHGLHDSFFSSVDHVMMTSRRSEEVHLVLSPSHMTYVATFKDLDNRLEEADLDISTVGSCFDYRRNG